jgi:hypothetical protein
MPLIQVVGPGSRLYTAEEGSSAGFQAESGFTVEADTDFSHGAKITITRSSGTWAAREYSEFPNLYDQGDKAWQDGDEVTPMAGLNDGDLVPTSGNTGEPWTSYGQAAHRIRLARSTGARAKPNNNTLAWWYSTTGASDMKTELFEPLWPSGWGTKNNQRQYLSFWLRMKHAYVSGTAFQGKYGRFPSGGSNYFYPGGCNLSLGNMEACGPMPQDETWIRLEYYADMDLNVLDIYNAYRYSRQIESSGTTPGPREWRSTSVYNAVSARGGYLYTNGANNTPFSLDFSDFLVATLGYDGQSGAVHGGQEHDIANPYADPEWERFEISNSGTWSLAPNNFGSSTVGTPREVQGRWHRVSDTVCEVWLNHGQFDDLVAEGCRLWYVNDFITAELIGQFVTP